MAHTRRSAVLGAAWLVSAVAATAFGLAAVQLLGDGLGTADAQVGSTTSSSTSATPGPSALPSTAHLVTEGGEVYATCPAGAGSRATVSAVPLAGWIVNTSNGGSTVEFRAGSRRLTVESDCTPAGPVLMQPAVGDDSTSATPSTSGDPGSSPSASTSEPGDDKGGDRPAGVSDDSSSPTSAASPVATVDDHGGGSGGGSGSGSSSGGHGSDD